MSVISIPSFTEKNKVVYYDITVRLPLRSIQTSKRYSDFEALLSSLCVEMGISKSDFPYSFPPKKGVFVSKVKVAGDRREKLTVFLTQLIKDRDIQNSSLIHEFLSLPSNFKFTRDFFEGTNENRNLDEKLLITDISSDITRIQWLSYLKNLKSMIESLHESDNLAARLSNRERVSKYIRPNIEKLLEALQHMAQEGDISPEELKGKTSMLSSLQSKMQEILFKNSSIPQQNLQTRSPKREASHATYKPVENTTTTMLSNTALLQHQKHIHQEQDQDLEELRKIIARQRQMGEAINREIDEQSELLDSFSNEVDMTGEKVNLARRKVKKIT